MTRLDRLLSGLERFYGALPSPPGDPFGVFVWEALSAGTTAARRDRSFNALRRIRALTPDSLSRAAPGKLSAAVSLAGPYLEQRLDALRAGAEALRRSPSLAERMRGPLPAARRALASLPRLGPADAPLLLLFAANHATLPAAPALVRAGARLGYGDSSAAGGAQRVRRALTRELPKGDGEAFRRAYRYLAHHGAATCAADPRCRVCPLIGDCPEGARRARAFFSSGMPSAAGWP